MSWVRLCLDKVQYFSGNIITGKVACFFTNRKDITEIRIRLKGKESTEWTDGESDYQSKYHFLLEDLIVHRKGTIGEGTHEFPFTFTLPWDIPESFHHKYGEIVYSVKLTVTRLWKSRYMEKKIITIISPIYLQRIPSNLQLSALYSEEETPCVLCCSAISANGPVQVNMFLEKRAFVVGETVDIKVYINNMSNQAVEYLTASMTMKLIFKADSQYRAESKYVFLSHNSGVGAHRDKTYDLSPVIPATTVVPNFTGCKLFSCTHLLKVRIAISGCNPDIKIKTDVALGHVPYPANQSLETVIPYPRDQPIIPEPITLQPMPMLLPRHEVAVGWSSDNAAGPSASQNSGATSAKLEHDKNSPGAPIKPMPMPLPRHEDTGGAVRWPSDSAAGYSLTGPSASRKSGATSAKLEHDKNSPGNYSSDELPPPSYYEATKKP